MLNADSFPMMNKMVVANLVHRPTRSLIATSAIALEVVAGALEYHLRRAILRLGRLGIPLPTPRTSQPVARETSCDDDKSVDVLVSARLPWLGLLVGYEGVVIPVD